MTGNRRSDENVKDKKVGTIRLVADRGAMGAHWAQIIY